LETYQERKRLLNDRIVQLRENRLFKRAHLKDAITSGQLDSIIKLMHDLAVSIDGSIAKVENSLQRLFRGITRGTSKIRGCTAKLISEHIEKIRIQLVNKLHALVRYLLKLFILIQDVSTISRS